MASLHARLIAGLLALAAVGLLALGSITYFEQRSFQLERVDRQAQSAAPAVVARARRQGRRAPVGHAGRRSLRAARRQGRRRPRAAGRRDEPAARHLRPAPRRRGNVLGDVSLSYGQTDLPEPDLPARMTAGELITVDAKGDSGLRYRAVALPERFGSGTTVVAVPLREADQTLDRLLLVEALVIAAVLVALGVLAWIVVRIGLRPLDRIGLTAGAIAAGDLSRRVSPATDKTEVGRLGIALNAMLDRLEEAFAERQASEDRLRRFLADASHELRTPLASIRGYAELFRIGAARDAAGTEKAMHRIEGEAARMGVLVEDLLTLARLDEVREAVRGDLDLGALARDAVDDARATAPERDIDVHTEPPTGVRGDGHQLRQVLANLLRNALVHTPPGTAIEVTVRPAGDEVVLTVRDHGPGLPGEDPQAAVRALLARRGRARARQGRRRPRAGHRRGDRRGPRGPRAGGERA